MSGGTTNLFYDQINLTCNLHKNQMNFNWCNNEIIIKMKSLHKISEKVFEMLAMYHKMKRLNVFDAK